MARSPRRKKVVRPIASDVRINLRPCEKTRSQDFSKCANCYKELPLTERERVPFENQINVELTAKNTTSIVDILSVIFDLPRKLYMSVIRLDADRLCLCSPCSSTLREFYSFFAHFLHQSHPLSFVHSIAWNHRTFRKLLAQSGKTDGISFSSGKIQSKCSKNVRKSVPNGDQANSGRSSSSRRKPRKDYKAMLEGNFVLQNVKKEKIDQVVGKDSENQDFDFPTYEENNFEDSMSSAGHMTENQKDSLVTDAEKKLAVPPVVSKIDASGVINNENTEPVSVIDGDINESWTVGENVEIGSSEEDSKGEKGSALPAKKGKTSKLIFPLDQNTLNANPRKRKRDYVERPAVINKIERISPIAKSATTTNIHEKSSSNSRRSNGEVNDDMKATPGDIDEADIVELARANGIELNGEEDLRAFQAANEQLKKSLKVINTKRYVCAICSEKFSRSDHVHKHMYCHLKNNFTCDICDAGFTRRWRFQEHMKTHAPNYDDSVPRGNYDSNAWRRKQAKKERKATKNFYKCDICGKILPRTQSLKSHMDSHKGEADKECICEMCGQAFKNAFALKKHFLFKHTDIREFVCATCGQAFKKKQHLKEHELSKHIGLQRIHKCEEPGCGKAFPRMKTLNEHRKIHGNIKFECEFGCQAKFCYKYNRKIHHQRCSLNPENSKDSGSSVRKPRKKPQTSKTPDPFKDDDDGNAKNNGTQPGGTPIKKQHPISNSSPKTISTKVRASPKNKQQHVENEQRIVIVGPGHADSSSFLLSDQVLEVRSDVEIPVDGTVFIITDNHEDQTVYYQ